MTRCIYVSIIFKIRVFGGDWALKPNVFLSHFLKLLPPMRHIQLGLLRFGERVKGLQGTCPWAAKFIIGCFLNSLLHSVGDSSSLPSFLPMLSFPFCRSVTVALNFLSRGSESVFIALRLSLPLSF